MGFARLLHDQLRQAHEFVNGTMVDVTDEQAHWQPAGNANPLGATYAHLALGEDAFVAALAGSTPLFEDSWSGRVGANVLPPLAEPGGLLLLAPEWHDWARSVRVDLPAMRNYAAAVHTASERFLTNLSDEALDRRVDLSSPGFGEQSMAWLVSSGLVGHVLSHWGEIACLEGLRSGRGFPF